MLKREITSFDVAALVYELNQAILGARINNVYQTDRKTLLLKLQKPNNPAAQLLIEAGKRLHLTSYVVEKPKTPPAFCMALRKYIRNGRLISVKQHAFERIVTFTVKTKTGIMKLITELFGEGNIILVNNQNKILQALKYKKMKDRNILRGEIFQQAPPSGKNPLKISVKDLEPLKKFGKTEVVRAIARFLSIGGNYAEEILLRAGIDKKKPCSELKDDDIEKIFQNMQDILSQLVNGRFEPCMVLDEKGKIIDVTPIRLKRYEGFQHQKYGSFNEALDEFYTKIITVEKKARAVKEAEEKLQREIARLRRIIESQEKALAEAERKAEKYKKIGNIIYAHLNELQTLMSKILQDKEKGKSWNEIVSEAEAERKAGLKPAEFFKALDWKKLTLNVCIDGLCFELNLRSDLFSNAAKFYEMAKKAKLKADGARTALEETRRKLEEIEAQAESKILKGEVKLAEVKMPAKRRRREWFEKFRWFVSSEGFLIVGGKDAVSNEVLIKKYTEPTDIVFHADIVGAPFVVIKCKDGKPSEQTIKEAAEFAASFSRAWREKFGSVDVFWVHPEQLSKGGISGTYVKRGGFIVQGRRNWLRGVELRTAVGVTTSDDGNVKFVGGPVDAVEARTKNYVIVTPGDLRGRELFNKILKKLASKAPEDLRKRILKASIEEIREFVPFGKGHISES